MIIVTINGESKEFSSLDINIKEEIQEEIQEFNFGDGLVKAHRHINKNGDLGGWVADSAFVAESAYVGKDAKIYGNAEIYGSALVYGNALVYCGIFS